LDLIGNRPFSEVTGLAGLQMLLNGFLQRKIEIPFPPDKNGQPVTWVELIGQAAVYQTGLARARTTVQERQISGEYGIVQLGCFPFPTKEAVLIVFFVGIEKFEWNHGYSCDYSVI
jgi:hypothetical protein